MLIAPKLFGKDYFKLRFETTIGQLANSELIHCSAEAQRIRLEARKLSANRGRDPDRLSMPELLELCEQVLNRPDALALQKLELKKRGYLPVESEVTA